MKIMSPETERRVASKIIDATIFDLVKIQHDASGQGHNWRDITAVDVPPQIAEEIAGEVIDGHRESGEIVASNGLRYRWS